MIVQRFCFFLTKATVWLMGVFGGTAAAFVLARNIFGDHPSSFQSVMWVGICILGFLFGTVGSHFSVVLPLHFLFPRARKLFSWESRDPPAVFRFYQWYGRELQDYGALRERGET